MDGQSPPKITRKTSKRLRVPVLPDEEARIKANAASAGLTVAEFLRRVSLGFPIVSIIDKQHISELSKINADLGRLGGLLKFWLTQDTQLKPIGEAPIRALLHRIEKTQTAMLAVVKKL